MPRRVLTQPASTASAIKSMASLATAVDTTFMLIGGSINGAVNSNNSVIVDQIPMHPAWNEAVCCLS